MVRNPDHTLTSLKPNKNYDEIFYRTSESDSETDQIHDFFESYYIHGGGRYAYSMNGVFIESFFGMR